jgi:hypothetical protein
MPDNATEKALADDEVIYFNVRSAPLELLGGWSYLYAELRV